MITLLEPITVEELIELAELLKRMRSLEQPNLTLVESEADDG